MKKAALLLASILVLLAFPAQAAMIVNDHFDDGSLDPAWNATPILNANGWTYQESGTNLTVTDIDPINSPVPSGSISNWAVIQLSRSFDPVSDFYLDFDLSWDEGVGGINSIQKLEVQVIGGQGSLVAWAGYYDNYNFRHGFRAAGGALPSPYASDNWILPNGNANVDIVRDNGALNIFWNDSLFWSGFSDVLVQEVLVNFGYYPYRGATIGSLSVDQVKLESTDLSATPEPGTMVLLGSALGLGAWWQRRRKRNKNIQA